MNKDVYITKISILLRNHSDSVAVTSSHK